jgi:diacylglycerol kinase family enzyme
MRLLIINNLSSGLRDGAIHDYVRKISSDGDEIVIRNTDGKTPIESLLDGAEGFDAVVAAGGDSTISSVCYGLRGSKIPVLPFPAGTGNLMATNIDSFDEPYALARTTKDRLTVDYDLGEIDFLASGSQDGMTRKGFAVMAGAGYDARIMMGAERLKGIFGSAAYLASAVSDPLPTVADFTITLDDEILRIRGIAVLVINFSKIFPDVAITHTNDARDGMFEVVVVKSQNAVELLPAIIAAFLDRDGGFPSRGDSLEIRLSRTVKVSSIPPLAIQYDGEAPGATTPFEARCLRHATRLIVSSAEHARHEAAEA